MFNKCFWSAKIVFLKKTDVSGKPLHQCKYYVIKETLDRTLNVLRARRLKINRALDCARLAHIDNNLNEHQNILSENANMNLEF